MREMMGAPGKKSGVIMRIGQCLFASFSMAFMASAKGFSTSTAFCYLIASMGLQVCWSFAVACFDIHAIRHNKELRTQAYVSLVAVGDWVAAILSLAAASSSAGVIILFARDTTFCQLEKELGCTMFKVSVSLAFISWFLLALSSYIMFWLLASI